MNNVPNLGEHFLYLNDDFFLMAELRPADFHTQAYGIVLRLQSDALVKPASKSGTASRGEWLALEHSNEILSRRFGYRKRPYLVHQVKTGSRPLMHEMGLVFDLDIRATARNTFRARPEGEERDVHATWLFANFVVERWREALLWTWTVARIGGSDDSWDRTVALQELGAEDSATITVSPTYRHTLAQHQVLATLGAEGVPRRTNYDFSSADGYPFASLTGDAPRSRWPNVSDVSTSTDPSIGCHVVVDDCFPRILTSASAVFKHVAFESTQCGDCVIKALVARSGVLGLETFLPHKHKTIAPDAITPATVPAHLPLASDWKQADYRLRAVVSGTNIREWTLRLLARYLFVIGSTPSHFLSISSPKQARNALAKVEVEDGAALLCINDNIAIRPDETSRVFREWQEGIWGERMAWERNTT
ncbi:hypothetical protein AURDEDRAFT_162942 [Auricularia subglabra TFB-10046 SS5]|nr:hypothetical protein AURDEDRAFT_162942 [Auricularia subglabra TFB-10046 SS5]